MSWLFDPHLCESLSDDEIQLTFERFHRDNPLIYRQFCVMVVEAKRKGWTRWSADAIFHVLRWEFWGPPEAGEDHALNNDFTSRYARLYMAQHPGGRGFFEVRKLRAKVGP